MEPTRLDGFYFKTLIIVSAQMDVGLRCANPTYEWTKR